ncbi:hypothetical protein CUPS4244_08980 [Campylobacter upsaliensis]|uniref:hypothetical protein n=1 Tax=Campylobacter upsaliensis TaxID=28080 RepID=UPI002149BCB8|nr:hypothetical protein [Campylobacter upsaliensis]MCR2105208.1 hypothetical protein [Campylobacter upsaliensis]
MFFVVGGAGSLLVDSIRFVDTPNFPDEYKPLANAQVAVLEYLKDTQALKWCFVSPLFEFVPDLPKGQMCKSPMDFFKQINRANLS